MFFTFALTAQQSFFFFTTPVGNITHHTLVCIYAYEITDNDIYFLYQGQQHWGKL